MASLGEDGSSFYRKDRRPRASPKPKRPTEKKKKRKNCTSWKVVAQSSTDLINLRAFADMYFLLCRSNFHLLTVKNLNMYIKAAGCFSVLDAAVCMPDQQWAV